MNNNQPFSRNDLQQLKAKKDEQIRISRIDQVVNQIYSNVINLAGTHTIVSTGHGQNQNYESKYNYQISFPDPKFCENNKDDIINSLKKLFPDCSIDYKMLSRGTDGKMYDITNIDEKMRPFINRQHDQAHIVIDWS
jgi:hypothetical protein